MKRERLSTSVINYGTCSTYTINRAIHHIAIHIVPRGSFCIPYNSEAKASSSKSVDGERRRGFEEEGTIQQQRYINVKEKGSRAIKHKTRMTGRMEQGETKGHN